ncbi:MAG: dTDP-glucose 4,6-dehydratase [Calditrichaceae bacterium]|nr:dTDP-glucose 4,6-dehydratase [Calditrichaceae bacterium]MBN2709398.1 dTDP-glucose 4,6-dehydratase [Calditrichaceae bacterium]RQV92464.1 MAG: dTDP-glucose 4,6-dehydratase [Calditrichota bacterium]
MKSILVTGGAGFIGSNFVRYMLNKYDRYNIIVLDALTYAGNRENLKDLEGDSRYRFVKGDIRDAKIVREIMRQVDTVVNFAAETHVDRSIQEAGSFIDTDIKGTFVLLEAAKEFNIERFLHISTDEVYGSIESGSFRESDLLEPNSPYSSSKAGGDLLVRSYFVTYGVPALITRSSNNYGPYQYPEKLIPLFVTNAIDDQPLPLYGDGKNVRDWIYVEDNCSGIDVVLHKGQLGQFYNIGGGNERENVFITDFILDYLGKPKSLIQPVKDRPGHDRRYSINTTKVKSLGWKPAYDLEKGLKKTIDWYINNEKWWRHIKEKQEEYTKFYELQYKNR